MAQGTGQRLAEGGRYRVRSGDSLHAIAFDFGLDWRDIAAWNGIRAPYVIYPDQELRVTPPQRGVSVQAAPAPSASTSDLPRSGTSSSGTASRSTAESSGPSTRGSAGSTVSPAVSPAVASRDPDRWLWPTEGRLVSTFKSGDPSRKGIDIGGREGQPVKATAAGEVVYSGSGLIGYGELIIIKHSDRMLSAYGHNRQRLVSEGQQVSAGERIAEMGRNDRNQVVLHFEIRLNGTPRDPLAYLPGR
jgi:lipoprotein NlpD